MGAGISEQDIEQAMQRRVSRRSYTGPVKSADIIALRALSEEYNRQSGLSIRIMQDGGALFNGFSKSYGIYSGVRSFFIMTGLLTDPHLEEKVGVYGEKLVLAATHLGLGTSWVGATFDRKSLAQALPPDKILVAAITVGTVNDEPSVKERLIRHAFRGWPLSLHKMYTANAQPPAWFIEGMRAVALAPSAHNRHPAHFTYKSGRVSAGVEGKNQYDFVDLGIAKLHFSIAAKGSFGMGNNAEFTPPQDKERGKNF